MLGSPSRPSESPHFLPSSAVHTQCALSTRLGEGDGSLHGGCVGENPNVFGSLQYRSDHKSHKYLSLATTACPNSKKVPRKKTATFEMAFSDDRKSCYFGLSSECKGTAGKCPPEPGRKASGHCCAQPTFSLDSESRSSVSTIIKLEFKGKKQTGKTLK